MDLIKLKNSCYSPYSGDVTICVAKSVKGNYFPGVRVENISYPLTITAAQSAIFSCLSEQEQPKAIYTSNPSAGELEFWKQEFNVWVKNIDDLGNIPFKRVIQQVDQSNVKKGLQDLLDDAITPNSSFPVSALLRTEEGFISGVNIECSEWGLGLCAERIAISKALAYGYSNFEELYLLTRDGEYSSPCGACRQVLIEHMPHHPVHMYHGDQTHSMHFTSDLLPYSFRSTTLIKNNESKK
jgi:homotetrameric cytidine deaminase